jgi:hypothetical protein
MADALREQVRGLFSEIKITIKIHLYVYRPGVQSRNGYAGFYVAHPARLGRDSGVARFGNV